MRSIILVLCTSLALSACLTDDGAVSVGTGADELARTPTWICCAFTCTTNGGQTHPTDACHPSSIGTDCPPMPARGGGAETCELVSTNADDSCEVCVNGLH